MPGAPLVHPVLLLMSSEGRYQRDISTLIMSPSMLIMSARKASTSCCVKPISSTACKADGQLVANLHNRICGCCS